MTSTTATVGTVTATLLSACVATGLLLGLPGLDASAPVNAEQLAPSPVADCPPAPDLSLPLTEIVSDGKGRARGMIVLADGRQAFPRSNTRCVQQLLRFYQTTEMPFNPTIPVPLPTPGPTVRARLGDVIQLLFLNQINTLDYGESIDVFERGKGDCDTSSTGYPKSAGDVYPNCFHGSTSGNIHYHGTHTNPNGVGDNVFLEIRPSPYSNGKPVVTEAEARKYLGTFFDDCEKRLRADNLSTWPSVWSDLPSAYTTWQQQLLIADGQGKPVPQQLWLANEDFIKEGKFPQYFIGAFPFCFVVPKFPGTLPTPGAQLRMGQAPGTHWYHAHKHGSTALNVSNGMSGAIIIEGDEYDGFFDKTYASFRQNPKTTWTRQQPTLVVNQYIATPNLERFPGRRRQRPAAIRGQRITAADVDDVSRAGEAPAHHQFLDGERLLHLATAPRLHLAADRAGRRPVRQRQLHRQGAAARVRRAGQSRRHSRQGAGTGVPVPTPIHRVAEHVGQHGAERRTLGGPVQLLGHGIRSSHEPRPGHAGAAVVSERHHREGSHGRCQPDVDVQDGRPDQRSEPAHDQRDKMGRKGRPHRDAAQLGRRMDRFQRDDRLIDHPFHIHINPFQVTEVFDPRAPVLDKTGRPVRDAKGQVVPVYMVSTTQPTLQAGQCWLNPDNKDTWKPCPAAAPSYSAKTNIWWDVFPIPAGIDSPKGTIPGYFKFRTRFVDYGGSYVLHCHILAHEDRGMMFQVNVGPKAKGMRMRHH